MKYPAGFYFLFISAKAMATMEFLQREWINSGNFTGIGEERDPLVGRRKKAPRSRFRRIR